MEVVFTWQHKWELSSAWVCESRAELLLTQVLCFNIRLYRANHSCCARLLLGRRLWHSSRRLIPLEIPLANRKHLRVHGWRKAPPQPFFFLWLEQCPCCLSCVPELLDVLPAEVSAAYSLGSTVLWSSVTCSLKAECLFPCYLTTLVIAEPERCSCCCLDDKAVTCPDLVAPFTWSLMHVGLCWKWAVSSVVEEYMHIVFKRNKAVCFIFF